uniref:Uncharacterized protein n=1 Tax=Poecilia latipinna TaxID=48699 RepID=A0A3B3VT73_9TELE
SLFGNLLLPGHQQIHPPNLNNYLAGFGPSQADLRAFRLLPRPPAPQHVHALRWYRHISALQARRRSFMLSIILV